MRAILNWAGAVGCLVALQIWCAAWMFLGAAAASLLPLTGSAAAVCSLLATFSGLAVSIWSVARLRAAVAGR